MSSTLEKISTLAECIVHAQSQGFVDEYRVSANDQVTSDGKHFYLPEDIKLINHYHFSGYSKDLEISTLWLIEEKSGKKGIIINERSSMAHQRTFKFIDRIKERTQPRKETAFLPRLMQLFFA